MMRGGGLNSAERLVKDSSPLGAAYRLEFTDNIKAAPATGDLEGRSVSFKSLIRELRLHTIDQPFQKKLRRFLSILFEVAVMRGFMLTGMKTKTFSAEKYIREMGANTDFQKFDDMIRMVLDCSPQQRTAITQLLEAERKKGDIVYGMHLSNEALLTCLVFQLDNHIHFVDGSNGGYALAAKQLKEQLRALNT